VLFIAELDEKALLEGVRRCDGVIAVERSIREVPGGAVSRLHNRWSQLISNALFLLGNYVGSAA